jgi:biotin carboxyl carrier protein
LSLQFGLYITLIGVISVFGSLAVVAFACITLKRFFKEEVVATIEPAETSSLEEMTAKAAARETGAFKIKINGEEHEVKIQDFGVTEKGSEEITFPSPPKEGIKVIVDKEEYTVKIEDAKVEAIPAPSGGIKSTKEAATEMEHVITAPMQGTVVKVPAKVGDTIEKGRVVLVLETMKMENAIESPVSGIIKKIKVSEGDTVNTDDILIVIV